MFNINRVSIRSPLNEDVKSLSSSFKDNTFTEHSYFIEAVEFCKKIDEEAFQNNKNFYRAVTESADNDTIIMESFSDWFSGFKGIIKKIIDFLHALLNKFIVGLNMLVKREGYLKDHKDDFRKFDDNHKFHISVYNFTIDNNDIPTEKVLRTFDGSATDIFKAEGEYNYEDLLTTGGSGIKFTAKNGSSTEYELNNPGTNAKALKDSITDKYDKFTDSLSDGSYYDTIRGEILYPGTGVKVDASDYSKELFELFRDGQGSKEDKEIEASDVNDSWNRFSNYEKIRKATTKKKNEVEKTYKSIQKKIEHSVKVDGGKLKYTKSADGQTELVYNMEADVARKFESLIKAQANAIQEISNLHTTAFAARLDAYKDQFNQDKTILYKALYRILGNIKTGKRGDY